MISAIGEYYIYNSNEEVRAEIARRVAERKRRQAEGIERSKREGTWKEETRIEHYFRSAFRGWGRRRGATGGRLMNRFAARRTAKLDEAAATKKSKGVEGVNEPVSGRLMNRFAARRTAKLDEAAATKKSKGVEGVSEPVSAKLKHRKMSAMSQALYDAKNATEGTAL